VYHRDGAPLSYRWGLYAGNRLYPQVRRIYFDHFRQQIFGETQDRLLQFLRNLPANPGPAYGETYNDLKAYLITTSHHEKSTQDFLAPVLLSTWSANRSVDPERLQLAQNQFVFYSEELKTANPFSSEGDGAAVERARRYLSQFAGFERVYQAMLTDAAKTSGALNFNRKFPGSAEVVVDAAEITGPFTKTGWDFMSKAMQSPDRYFNGEQWVLGNQSVATNLDYSKLTQDLRQRYQSDFASQWLAYLKGASVVRYGSLKDAARKLNVLSGNQSPLLALFWLASQNTSVDDPQVAKIFQPVQAVVPPASVDRYVAPSNQNYMNALVTLQSSLDALSNQPEGNDAAAQQTLTNASAASVAARQLAQGFRLDPQTHVDTIAQKLLEDPITYAEALLRNLGPAELNAKGKGFCTQLRQLTSKYPFNPSATTDATLYEVNNIFSKPNGALWAFYQSSLQKLLTKQGNAYVPAAGGTITLTPAFVSFFNQAAAFSDSLYANGSQDPRITYMLKPVATEGIGNLGLQIDGQTLNYSGGPATPKDFAWQASGPHEAKATVQFGSGPDLTWSSNDGLWAVFRFFGKADRRQPTPNGELLEWTIRIGREAVTLPGNKPLTVRLELSMPAGSPPVFQRGFLSRLSCVSQVAR
ncbi:MAG TPA: ImcF-related family protein, partial [Bryobacteraceae bacterium]|nr:ImcF-related family protein [Bryobacteraceae bacterium]